MMMLHRADVAELADALGSGLSSRKGVEVQVLSSAPTLFRSNHPPNFQRRIGRPTSERSTSPQEIVLTTLKPASRRGQGIPVARTCSTPEEPASPWKAAAK